MKNDKLYYKESGAVGMLGPVLIAVLGPLACLILGAVYAYATYLIPIIYVNFLLTAGFGFGVGFTISKAGYYGKIRNTKVMLSLGVLFGIVASYFGWVFWIHAASEQEVLTFSLNHILLTMDDLAEYGSWSIFKWTPTGAALYTIWVVEAAIIIFFATTKSTETSSALPFCENCEKWTESKTVTSNLEPIPNIRQFVTDMESRNFDGLMNMEFVDPNSEHRTKVELLKCDSCEQNHYLSVKHIAIETDDDGKESEDETLIMENLILDKQSYQQIEELKKEAV